MTSLKNALPLTSKKKPKKGQPTLEQLKTSFDVSKTKLDEEMDISRRLFSPLPLSTPPPKSLLVLTKDGLSLELLSGRERQIAMEEVFSLCGAIGGEDQMGIALSDAVGAVDKVVCMKKSEGGGGVGGGGKKEEGKGAEKKEDKDAKRSTAGFRRSQLGKLF